MNISDNELTIQREVNGNKSSLQLEVERILRCSGQE